MQITITNILALTDLPQNLHETVCERLTFPNPKYLENEKMGRWNGDTPETFRFYTQAPDGSLEIPRGYIRQLINLCRGNGIQFHLEDQRRLLPEVSCTFTGTLKPFQTDAVNIMLAKDFGTLAAPTGSGKTVMALAMVAKRGQPTLIVVHTKELLDQWIDRIEQFLSISASEVGIIGNGKHRIGDRITVALVQSLYKCADEVAPQIGHLIVDECHRAPSRTFTEAVTAFDCRYMLGLSATPWRRDKLSRLIFWHLGDVQHEIDKAVLQESGDILKAEVITRETNFRPYCNPTTEYSRMLSELTEDQERNFLIAEDVAQEVCNGGGIVLVLTDRKSHCVRLQAILRRLCDVQAEVLIGDLPAKQRKVVVDRLNQGEIKVLVATGQLIGEGFDCPNLSTLFLATPVKHDGRVLQYLGRVLRPAPGKDRAKIYDYIDVRVPPLVASAKSRQRVYMTNQ